MIVESDATFDETRTYRYTLGRRWHPGKPIVAFLMLNPSTADENVLDPTLKRCMNFAGQWGYGGMEIANLFAYRSTNPQLLRHLDDPVGPENDRHILEVEQRCAMIVAGWGVHGTYRNRVNAVLTLRQYPEKWFCLGTTKNGEPRHPLYLASTTMPQPYNVQMVSINVKV